MGYGAEVPAILLDLHAMGMIGPEEVPDAFLIRNPKQIDRDLVSGQKVPVRIADVIGASGQRVPDVGHTVPAARGRLRMQVGVTR
jgi:hypothetical protein